MRVIEICSVLFTVLLVKAMASTQRDALRIIKANNKYASTMYEELSRKPENVFYSPLGLLSAMSVLQQGAESATLEEFSATLNLPNKARAADGFQRIIGELNDMDNATFKIENKLYVQTGFSVKPAFKDIVAQKFNTAIENVDFRKKVAAAKTINTWIKKKTHPKVKDLIKAKDIMNNTDFMIVNSVNFKGEWLVRFEKFRTWTEGFYTSRNGSNWEVDVHEVDTMHLTNKMDYKYDVDLNARIIRLPYSNKKLSMVFILPDNRRGINELEENLANYDLSLLTEGMSNIEVFLAMPRFKIEIKRDLMDAYLNTSVNSYAHNTNFSSLFDNQESLSRLYWDKVVQTAFIEVNEEGREAAPTSPSGEKAPMSLRFNHPFMFALLRKRNILFYGKITSFD